MRGPEEFISISWSDKTGKLLLEPRFNESFIYQTSLPAGVGSNPIGLDRGELSGTHLVHFERVGPRVLLVEESTKFRAITDDAAERKAVTDSFATSILAGFNIESESGDRIVIDATDFFLSDMHGVIRRLRDTQQGAYSLDKTRSAIYAARTKAFPRNTEIEATLTFVTTDKPGPLVSSVTPVPEIVTVREHHSLVALPPPGYTPRNFDPRINSIGVEVYDYATPFTAPLERRWVTRHRLQKDQKLVYYVDPGAPEPVRSALIEGAGWWSQALPFEVRVLPPDADPMDIRYNMINWIHRSTRGWSYGESVLDPRTGEIIKGNVRLGSLRMRQDFLIARGLGADEKTAAELALARVRQLAAHEVGHTLGFDHNMAASSSGRASVMDYPAPNIRITADGKLDFSDAYAKGLGAYDKAAVRYVYFDDDSAARTAGLFVKDADSRNVNTAHPLGSVWDNGADPVQTLAHELEVRRIALEHFGLDNLREGEPLSSLEEILLPLYLHHRYQLEAAAKSVGGLYYTYALKESGGPARQIVPAAKQREALALILSTLDPKFLAIPQRIVDLIPPRAFGYEGGIAELFEKKTAPVFDPISAAVSSADITLAALLDPNRCARLIEFHEENKDNPPLSEVLDKTIDSTMKEGAISFSVRALLAQRLMELASNTDAAAGVRAEATEALRRFAAKADPALRDDIERFLKRPAEATKPAKLPEVPPGPPI
ncbi:MAG TPA: zinc-dependent metalloprotease [Thermoanaerobaculia bacterium]|nr:zinc-dependent metalloprotease [Thermoanaerobaculia bacterium]